MRIPFFTEKRSRRSVAAFLALLALLGALMIDDYGATGGEYAAQAALSEDIKQYAAIFGDQEAARSYDARGGRGQAAYYLAAPILKVGDGWMRSVLWHLYTWCWFMAGVCALYALCRTLNVGYLLSCMTALLLYLTPRLFAEGHYAGGEIAPLSLALITLALGARFLCSPTWRRAMLFSLAGALAVNARVSGLWAWAALYGFALARAIARRKLDRDARIGLITAPITLVLLYAALTPALWTNPAAYFGAVSGTNASLFQGTVYDTALPHWYLPVMLAVTTPVATLLLIALGQFRACVAWKRAKGRRLVDERPALLGALTLYWLAPMACAMILRPSASGGWRDFYFLYAGLLALAGFGMQSLAEAMRKAEAGRAICAGAVAICLAYYGCGVVINHPFQYAYYNSLVGALDAGRAYALDDQGVSTINALRRLCNSDRNQRLALTVAGTDERSARGVEDTYAALPQGFKALITLANNPAEANYRIENTTSARLDNAAPPEEYRALFTLSGYGREICVVYERIAE